MGIAKSFVDNLPANLTAISSFLTVLIGVWLAIRQTVNRKSAEVAHSDITDKIKEVQTAVDVIKNGKPGVSK